MINKLRFSFSILAFCIMTLFVVMYTAGASSEIDNVEENAVTEGSGSQSEEPTTKTLPENNTKLLSQSTSPKIIERSPPVYPLEARKKGWEGRVALSIAISEKGTVLDVYIIKSSGFSILDNAAVDSARKWRFAPAQTNGKAMFSCIAISINFKLTPDIPKDEISDEIKMIQQKLNELGFNCGESDGYLCIRTIRAIREFQRSKGFDPNGTVDAKTREALGL